MEASVVPKTGIPTTGAELTGAMPTVTGIAADPPLPSMTVAVKVSTRSAAPAPSLAALCRAVGLGVYVNDPSASTTTSPLLVVWVPL